MERPLRRLLGLATGAYATRRALAGGAGHRGPRGDHFDGKTFHNENPAATAGKTFAEFLRWQRTHRRAAWPEWVEHPPATTLPRRVATGECAATFVNHITFLLQFRGLNVLTDPVYSGRCSPVQWAGPKRVHAPGVPFDRLPHIDLVLVSHDHYDHLDLDTLQRLERVHRPVFLTGLGNGPFLREHGLARVHEYDWWQAHEAAAWRCTYVPAQHWSGRGLQGRNRTLWGGFVLEADRLSRVLRRRHRLLAALRDGPRALRRAGSRPAADRRVRAALVHARPAHGPRGGGPCAPRPRRAPEPRDALRLLPAH